MAFPLSSSLSGLRGAVPWERLVLPEPLAQPGIALQVRGPGDPPGGSRCPKGFTRGWAAEVSRYPLIGDGVRAGVPEPPKAPGPAGLGQPRLGAERRHSGGF